MARLSPESYSSQARLIALRRPYLTSIAIQINFWILSYLLLVTLIYFGNKGVLANIGVEYEFSFIPPLLMSLFLGAGYGFVMGTVYYSLDNPLFKNRPFWQVVLYQLIVSVITLSILMSIARYLIFETLMQLFWGDNLPENSQAGWPYFFLLMLIYTIVMSVLISFIIQMNKKFGPGILIPMFLGRYRNPRETERIFMFLDLKDSTTIAERLGHILYSELIRDCFSDINEVVQIYLAEIYQYVGDEVVLSWEPKYGLKDSNVISIYFSVRDKFESRKEYYTKKFGVVPEFKAGAHLGKVTVVEVGEIKRDLAFHGDTLNVASRIENLCKTLKKNLLISVSLKNMLEEDSKLMYLSMGKHDLKGRRTELEIFEVIEN